MFGGWKRLSFKENDAFIDRARQFCAKRVAKDYKDEYKLSPMEVYSQVVNGKNYKVLLIGKHFKNGDLKCFSGVTYVAAGPKPQPVFQDNTFKAVDGKDCTLAADKKDKLAKAVADYFKGAKDFEAVKVFELDGANVYVLKVGNDLVGAFECGDVCEVDCNIR